MSKTLSIPGDPVKKSYNAPRLISKAAACRSLGVSRSTLWRLQSTEGFPRAIKLPTGAQRFRAEDINAYISGLFENAE